jgi:hypothetical protein
MLYSRFDHSLKKLFRNMLRPSSSQEDQQQQPQPSFVQNSYQPPVYQSSSPYPPPPSGPSYAHPHPEGEWKPPIKENYRPPGNGIPQQPFQGHKTHIGDFHDQVSLEFASLVQVKEERTYRQLCFFRKSDEHWFITAHSFLFIVTSVDRIFLFLLYISSESSTSRIFRDVTVF